MWVMEVWKFSPQVTAGVPLSILYILFESLVWALTVSSGQGKPQNNMHLSLHIQSCRRFFVPVISHLYLELLQNPFDLLVHPSHPVQAVQEDLRGVTQVWLDTTTTLYSHNLKSSLFLIWQHILDQDGVFAEFDYWQLQMRSHCSAVFLERQMWKV